MKVLLTLKATAPIRHGQVRCDTSGGLVELRYGPADDGTYIGAQIGATTSDGSHPLVLVVPVDHHACNIPCGSDDCAPW